MPAGEVVHHYEQHRDIAGDVDDHNVRNTHSEPGLALEIPSFGRHPIDAVYLTLMSTQDPKYLKVSAEGYQEAEQ